MPKKGERLSPEAREKIRQARLKYFREDPEAREKISRGRRKNTLQTFAEDGFDGITHRRCSKCDELKSVDAFYVRAVALKCGVISIRPEQPCKVCRRAYDRARRMRMEAEGEDLAARERKRWAEASEEAKRRRRERQRERAAVRRRKEGRPVRGPYKRQDSERRLSPEPLATFLRGREERESKELISARTKVPKRTIFAIMEGERKSVTLGIVDAILTGLDCQGDLHDLYPEETRPKSGYAVLDPDGVLKRFAETGEVV